MAGSITINSNLAALNAQRRLGQNTQALQQSFSRLTSGLRINKASDDAAGLAISELLNVDARVYAQGTRNLNDGISLINIAEGAMRELTNITIRQRELAEQSANETYSPAQRTAMGEECDALSDEYLRIVQSASFNGLSLLSGGVEVRTQAGYGLSGSITFFLPSLETQQGCVGTGSFDSGTTFASGHFPSSVALGDFNGDGVLDMMSTDNDSDTASVFIGNGDGSFKARSSFATGQWPRSVTLADINGDSILDAVTANKDEDNISVLLGNGNGTFKTGIESSAGWSPLSVMVGDLNGDHLLDMVAADSVDDTASVLLGNGNGTFKARSTLTTGDAPQAAALADFNGDGILDFVTADASSGAASVFIGNGNGTFKARSSFSAAVPYHVTTGDVNGDSIVDLITVEAYASRAVSVFIGNGNGTFKTRVSYSTGVNPQMAVLGDLNGDEMLDIVAVAMGDSHLDVFIGNGDGSFKGRSSFYSDGARSAALGDLNADGVLDVAVANWGVDSTAAFLAITQEPDTAPRPDIYTRQSALDAMGTIDATLQRISTELGSLGSVQSRLSVAVNTISVTRENYLSARSQITDADVSEESAQLVKNRILQQAGTAVLAQANQAPALALRLLQGS